MKNLLVFGDSWANGDELKSHENPFGKLIAQQFCYYFENCSQSSTGIPHLLLQLRTAIDNKMFKNEDVALFFLSGPDRDLIFQNNKAVELHPHNSQDVDWYARYSSDQLSAYRTNTTLIALQKICEIYNLNSFFIWGWEKVELWPEVNTQHFYPLSCAEMFDSNFTNFTNLKNSKNKYIWPNGGHPNQMGHQLIADNLSKFIQEKLTLA